MNDLPNFMKTSENKIPKKSQSKDTIGWFFQGTIDIQMAYWICKSDGKSKEHVHDFDEYFIVAQGEYILIINGEKFKLHNGDEYFIKKESPMQENL